METFESVIAEEQPVLVDFYATWCQPCKMMHPVLQQTKAAMGERLRIIKVDVDKHQSTAARYQIRSVPTLMLFKRGQTLWRQSGAMTAKDLMDAIEPYLK